MIDHSANSRGAPTGYHPVRAPRGTILSSKGWAQEGAMRALMNSLDPEVAENPRDLVLYGGIRRAVRDWDCFHAIMTSLRELENDQTLLVHSGGPFGIFRTQAEAPRLIVVGAFLDLRLAPNPSPPAHSHQATAEYWPAGSWLYVGTQIALPDAIELFAALARKYFTENLAGKLVVACGMGALGGALPLAAVLNKAAFLGIDADAERIKRRVKSGYCDVMVNDLDEALRILKNAVRKREATSVGLIGNCAVVIPELARRGVVPDLLTSDVLDHTSGPLDPIRYIPQNLTVAQAFDLRRRDPRAYREQALDSIADHVRGMLALQRLGAVAFDCGTGILALAKKRGVHDAFEIRDLVSETAAPMGGPARDGRVAVTSMALSGEPADIARVDRLLLEVFPDDNDLQRWIVLAGKHVRFQGLPARVCRLESSGLIKFALAVNELVAQRELKAPMVIGQLSIVDNAAVAETIMGDAAGWSVIAEALSLAGSASWIAIDPSGRETGSARWSVNPVIVADGTVHTSHRIHTAMAVNAEIADLQPAHFRWKSEVEAAEHAQKQLIKIFTP